MSQHKTLKQYKENSTSTLSKGLKALSKQSRERLEAYQHLFYLLQTNPVYLAKLIFEMPQSKTTKFMESVILTIYNYASNHREEYLLLKLFKTALKEEIRWVFIILAQNNKLAPPNHYDICYYNSVQEYGFDQFSFHKVYAKLVRNKPVPRTFQF